VGGTLLANVTGADASYTVSVSGMVGSGTVVASVPAAVASSAGEGHLNAASTSTDNSVTFADPAPTVTINQAMGQADPTNGSPVLFTVVFSEPVTGFDGSDVGFAGSTVGGTLMANVTGSGATYTVSVTGMSGTGNVVASLPAGAALDINGNASFASTSTDNTVTFDNVAPTVAIDQAAGQADPTNLSPILFTVVFSEPVTGFTGSDVSFAGSTVGGTLSANVTGSGATYTVSVTGMTGTGDVVASLAAGAATDSTGNTSLASTSTDNTVAFDNVAPTVAIDQAAGQADPTDGSPILFTVVFSEPVTGFTQSDVSFAGSTVGGTLVANVTGSGATYTVSVTGMSGLGTVVASVVLGAAGDAAGNTSLASTTTDNSVTFFLSPIVTTDAATGVGEFGATLNGTVNPNGVATQVHFEYGSTSSYGSTTASQNVGAGTLTVPVSQALTGITCNTTQHFRAVAVNAADTAYGGDQTFTTAACLPSRVFVSVLGLDTNDCSNIATPCRTLGAAILQVATDGEVIVTRSGSYAGATIAKGVKVDAASGVVAFSGQPIVVNPGAGARVVIRGMTVKAATPGTGTGIQHQSGDLFLEGTVVDGWQVGLSSSSAGNLYLTRSTVRNNTGAGVSVASAEASLESSLLEGNGTGLQVLAGKATVTASVLSGNLDGLASLGTVKVNVEKSQLASNQGSGAFVSAGELSLTRCVVTGNGVGLNNLGGTVTVTGTNAIRGNTTNTSGTITIVGLQ
jgi:hypothetical protein